MPCVLAAAGPDGLGAGSLAGGGEDRNRRRILLHVVELLKLLLLMLVSGSAVACNLRALWLAKR